MCRLPSPIWPKATQNGPGATAAKAASISAITPGRSDTWKLMSFITQGPCRCIASSVPSRIAQKFARCASDCAITASSTRPASKASARIDSSSADSATVPSGPGAASSGRAAPSSISTASSGASSKTGLTWSRYCTGSSYISLPISSNASTWPPQRDCVMFISSSAASTSRTLTMAVAKACGGVTSFRLAAVMMPSVPSEPTIRLTRS